MKLYKPSSLLRLHTTDTSALPLLELGLMPVVTTMVVTTMGEAARSPRGRRPSLNISGQTQKCKFETLHLFAHQTLTGGNIFLSNSLKTKSYPQISCSKILFHL